MKKFVSQFVEFMKKEDGPTAVEYAVMLALILWSASLRSPHSEVLPVTHSES
jgi:hypothetical protein